MVLDLGRAAGLPVAMAMARGYARKLADTVDIHISTVGAAAHLCRVAQKIPRSFVDDNALAWSCEPQVVSASAAFRRIAMQKNVAEHFDLSI